MIPFFNSVDLDAWITSPPSMDTADLDTEDPSTWEEIPSTYFDLWVAGFLVFDEIPDEHIPEVERRLWEPLRKAA
jgi:hypothetical protein